MGNLKKYIEEECDVRLVGYLAHSVKEAYKILNELIEANPIFKNPEMKQSYGHIRQALVNAALRIVLENSDLPCKVEQNSVMHNKNGYKYTMVEAKGAIISPVKTRNKKYMPRKAAHRSTASLKNAQIDLFNTEEDLNEKYDENTPPFMLLTYGGKNHHLQYIELGLPDISNEKWIDKLDITNAMIVLNNDRKVETVQKELNLSLTKLAEELLKGVQDGTNTI